MLLKKEDVFINETAVLGKGASATTYGGILTQVLSQSWGFAEVAVKCFKKDVHEAEVKFEIGILSLLQKRSQHILQMVGYSEAPFRVIMRLYPRGALGSYIYDTSFKYLEGFVLTTAMGIAEGMAAIHTAKIVHFDLKPANVLLDESMQPVIADFGVAKIGGSKLVAGMKDSKITGFTPAYAAPEVYGPTPDMVAEVDKKTDVFAYAITVHELLHRRHPWSCVQGIDDKDGVDGSSDGKSERTKHPSAADIKRYVLAGLRLKMDEESKNSYPKLVELITQSWENVPLKRPPFSVIVNDLKNDLNKHH